MKLYGGESSVLCAVICHLVFLISVSYVSSLILLYISCNIKAKWSFIPPLESYHR